MASRIERSLSFGSVASDYDRLRPGPPPQAIDWLLPARRRVVVDLAAGTGLLTRAVTDKAGHVIAVEPDDRMRAVLAARSPEVDVLAGRGEAIPLPEASADAVLVSSAWHWMDPELAVPEVSRVLRDGGRFGLIWTGRDRSTEWLRADDWFSELAAGPDSEAGASDVLGLSERRRVSLPDREPFVNIETATFRFIRRMTVPDLVDMLTTYSRVITADTAVREAGRARATAALLARFPGAELIEVPMRSRCWRADRLSRPGVRSAAASSRQRTRR